MHDRIPQDVKDVMQALTNADFEAYIVGGCVRDLLMDIQPKDWDVTTNATPEQIQALFPDSFYENDFGTVGVKTRNEDDTTLAVIEVTTYRVESTYSNKRHPDTVSFTTELEDDLQRRDFTINAIAMDAKGAIVDPYEGQKDIHNNIIKAVGDPEARFGEDALRMMRAVRFVAALGFKLDPDTQEEIIAHHSHLKDISQERIRDEFIKLISADHAYDGIVMLHDTHMLEYVLPELLDGVGIEQNLHHIYTVWEHNILSLKYAADQRYSFEVRLASLLHDVGKPKTKRGQGYNATFYGHDVVGERMVRKALDRLKFPKDTTDKIAKLVRWHMFYYDTEVVTEAAVRRLVARIGKENVQDLIKVREADRIGSGVPKAKPYKLRHLQFMIDKVARDPISPKMLKINGDQLMPLLGLEPSPKVGMIINALMEEILDDPSKNTKDYLESRAKELNDMTETELQDLKRKGQVKMADLEARAVAQIKDKHYVK